MAYRPRIEDVLMELGFDPENSEFSVISNIALQVAFCRIYYRRRPGHIPKIIAKRAMYWKQEYNSELGKGTPEHYLEANK